MPGQNGAKPVCSPGEGLMERRARAARIGEEHVDTVAAQRLDNHIGPADEGFGGSGA